MHRAFNITNCQWNNSSETGSAIFTKNSDDIRKSLEPFITGQIVDGTKLTNHWFPVKKADVFISHSHADKEQAIRCAGWLKNTFGLEPFIDSCVWGHAAELLKIIDTEYCKITNTEMFDYEKRNDSTSHVHMMLSTALAAMLDATECVMFINTRNSITSQESIAKTQSPWLSLELGTMRIIRRKQPDRKGQIRNFANESKDVIKASRFIAEYEVPLSELTTLTTDEMNSWKKVHEGSIHSQHPLDLLYDIAPEQD
jgi:hypothetical protein